MMEKEGFNMIMENIIGAAMRYIALLVLVFWNPLMRHGWLSNLYREVNSGKKL